MDKCIGMLQDFYLRRERIYLMADFTDIVLSFLRNGAAYAWYDGHGHDYQIHMCQKVQINCKSQKILHDFGKGIPDVLRR